MCTRACVCIYIERDSAAGSWVTHSLLGRARGGAGGDDVQFFRFSPLSYKPESPLTLHSQAPLCCFYSNYTPTPWARGEKKKSLSLSPVFMNGRKAPEEEVGVGSFIPSLYHGLLLLLLPLGA